MARTRNKYSIFCKNKPSQLIGFGAIYLSDDRMWVIVKGRRYQNGRFRYIYNGREGTVGQFHWVNLEGLSYSAMEEKIREMNWSVLSSMYPRKKKNRNNIVVTTNNVQTNDPLIASPFPALPIVDIEYEPTGN